MNRHLTEYIAVAVVVVCAVATAGAQRTTKIDAPADGVTVPMASFGGRPVFDVRIGKDVHPMVLDTGAARTVIDPAWLDGETGPAVLDVGIGALTLRGMAVGRRRLGIGPPDMPGGVFSAGEFPGYLLTLDYPKKTITIRRGALPAADGKRVFEYDALRVLPVVPVVVAGRTCVIHVDSGGPAPLMLPLHYAKELPLGGELTRTGSARTVAGEFELFAAPVKGPISLGEFTLDVPSVNFSDLRPGAEPGIGHIGGGVLKDFRLTVDSANRRLRFER